LYLLSDGSPAHEWHPSPRSVRFGAWLLDVALCVLTLGVGWLVWLWRDWARATTPGKAMFGLAVFGTDTRQPATRSRMARRALVYQLAALSLGVATLGLGWLYCLAMAFGSSRCTVYDEWSRVIVLRAGARRGGDLSH
jgi:hypothetical protein